MRWGWAWWVIVVGCASGGDNDNQPGPSTFGVPTSTGGAAETEAPAMMSTGSSGDTSGSTSGLPTDPTSGGPAGTTDPATTAVDSSSSGDPLMCDPEKDDIECLTCIKASCCPEYDACLEDENCACAVDCIKAGGVAEECAMGCGSSAPVTALVVCGAIACDLPCDGI